MYVPGPCVCRDGRTENRDGRTALKVMNVHIHIFKYKHAQMIKYQSIKHYLFKLNYKIHIFIKNNT